MPVIPWKVCFRWACVGLLVFLVLALLNETVEHYIRDKQLYEEHLSMWSGSACQRPDEYRRGGGTAAQDCGKYKRIAEQWFILPSSFQTAVEQVFWDIVYLLSLGYSEDSQSQFISKLMQANMATNLLIYFAGILVLAMFMIYYYIRKLKIKKKLLMKASTEPISLKENLPLTSPTKKKL